MRLNNCDVRLTVTTSSNDGEYLSLYINDKDSMHTFASLRIPKEEAFNLFSNRAAKCSVELTGVNMVGKRKVFRDVVMEDVNSNNFYSKVVDWKNQNPGWYILGDYNYRNCHNGVYTTIAHSYEDMREL